VTQITITKIKITDEGKGCSENECCYYSASTPALATEKPRDRSLMRGGVHHAQPETVRWLSCRDRSSCVIIDYAENVEQCRRHS